MDTQETEAVEGLFETTGCPLCRGAEVRSVYPVNLSRARAMTGLELAQNSTSVAVCETCGHQFVHPVPTARFLDAFYGNYMSKAKEGIYADFASSGVSDEYRQRYGTLVRKARQLNPNANSLLDVGSGMGMFMRLAAESGYDVVGVEPSASGAAQQRSDSFEVFQCTIEAFETQRKFDVVSMWDLLEHIPDVESLVKKVHGLLDTEGLLLLEIPVRDSVAHTLVKAIYRCSLGKVKAPLFNVCGLHHLHYFSQQSFEAFLQRQGFQVEYVGRRGTNFDAKYRGQKTGPIGQRLFRFLFLNIGVASVFITANVLRRQNKLVVIARKAA